MLPVYEFCLIVLPSVALPCTLCGAAKCQATVSIVQGDRSLMVQWMDVNQLSQEENLHSKCLCINRLPLELGDSEELAQLFSETYKPVFCQVRPEASALPQPCCGCVFIEGQLCVRFCLCTLRTAGDSDLHTTKDLSSCGSLSSLVELQEDESSPSPEMKDCNDTVISSIQSSPSLYLYQSHTHTHTPGQTHTH